MYKICQPFSLDLSMMQSFNLELVSQCVTNGKKDGKNKDMVREENKDEAQWANVYSGISLKEDKLAAW